MSSRNHGRPKPTSKKTKKKKSGRGGARPGAGRKPKGDVAGVSHRTRPRVPKRCPIKITMRMLAELPSLRSRRAEEVLHGIFEDMEERPDFQIVLFAIEAKQIHMILETVGKDGLARGVQSLSVRIARRLNRLWERKGTVFADRYEAFILRTPTEMRDALDNALDKAWRYGLVEEPWSSDLTREIEGHPGIQI